MEETKGNDTRNKQSHNKTHTRVRFQHRVTTSFGPNYQQTADNTKHRTQNSNWVHNIHQHITYTRRKTHTTHKRTLPTTRITSKKTITLHHTTTNNTGMQETNNIPQHRLYHRLNTNPNTINNAQIKTNIKHIYTTILNTYLNNRKHDKVTNTIALSLYHSASTIPSATRRTQNNQVSHHTFIFKQNPHYNI